MLPKIAFVLIGLAVLLLVGIDHRARARAALLWRALHLLALGLWVGGATWNLTVAIPVGIHHPTIEAVISGALQLQHFRRVARVALPTVVATGVAMALPYLTAVGDLVLTTPGRFIVVTIGLIVALVVIFITCPLFRQCSPVAGVCDLDELDTLTEPGATACEANGEIRS